MPESAPLGHALQPQACPSVTARHPLLRALWLLGGWLSLLLGFIGLFLPLLPTTPFVLLAAFCFSRGSARWSIGW